MSLRKDLPIQLIIGFGLTLQCSAVHAGTVVCNQLDQAAVAEAITRIEQGEDPCGESAEVVRLLEKVKESVAVYRICSDPRADRNSFDRVPDKDGKPLRTITWNPELRNELEVGCDGDPSRAVLRDPSASLLHELAHAAQDADGLDPTGHELEAVRIENIYRRAAGLCQRAHYGSDPLPPSMLISCEPGYCRCTSPTDAARPQMTNLQPAPNSRKQSLARNGNRIVRTSDSTR